MLSDGLPPESRRRLANRLVANQTGHDCLRARTAAGWRVCDETGSGERGTRNDVAILRPPDRAPFIVAPFIPGANAGLEQRNVALESVAKAVTAQSLGRERS